MTVLEIVNSFVRDHATLFVLLLSLIEIAPIKVNPISFLVKWIGQVANSKMIEELEDMQSRVKKMEEKQEFNEAMTSRYRIIRASDEIMNGQELSDDHIDQLGEDVEIYDSYCRTHPNYLNHKGQKSKEIVLEYEREIMKKKGSASNV